MPVSQRRAVQTYRARLSARGLARFEVLGRAEDRDLIRQLARQLAENSPRAVELRGTMERTVKGEQPPRGGILAALRRAPSIEIDVTRPRLEGRETEL
jgi:hypothetical protein